MGDRVYIATATVNAPAARDLAVELREAGNVVVSTWHDRTGIEGERAREAVMTVEERERIATRCFEEITDADRVIVLSHPAMRGALVEMGIALGEGLEIEWRGDEGVTLFSTLAEVRRG